MNNMAKIMVVDDSKVFRELIIDILEKNGHEVVGEAEDGLEAINLYPKITPDIVLLDIIMPKISGNDAIKGLLKIDPNAKIIICSTLDFEDLIEDTISLGVKGYIIKPINNASEIIDKIKSVLNS